MSVVLATDTVHRAHAALVHGNFDEALATCDPRVRWHVSDGLPFGGLYYGVKEVGSYFSELAHHFSSLLVTLTEVVATHQVVVEQGTYRGVARESQIPFEATFCVIWQLRDGRIYDVREHSDTAVLNAALAPLFPN